MRKRAFMNQNRKKGIFAGALSLVLLLSVYMGSISASANGATLSEVNAEVAYSNSFDAVSDMPSVVAWGKQMSSTSGSGYLNLEQVLEEDGNSYLKAYQTGNGSRGSRLDLESAEIKAAEVTFDWMPLACNDRAKAQLLFLSNEMWHSYFTLGFGPDYKLYAFTENAVEEASTQQQSFAGSVSADKPIEIGFGAKDTWYTVNLKFDYLEHTVDFTIYQKDNTKNTFKQSDLPIEAEADGIRSMVFHMHKLRSGASVSMGLDNIVISYDKFTANDLIQVTNPEDVALSKETMANFTFPKNVVVKLGDGSRARVNVGNWTAAPAFDSNENGDYIWTAEVLPGKYTSYLAENTVSFLMKYMVKHYPTYVFCPATLELEFGEEFVPEQMPTQVMAYMNDGTVANVNVGEWTAIREFNSAEEGIYVYGANIEPLYNAYEVNRDLLMPNENPGDPSEQRVDYIYDVYYRISYFKTEDNYNAYTRTMEYLDRGVYAVEREDGVFVSWRLLVTEYGEDIAFNVYRNGVLVNAKPIDSKTNFVDAAGMAGDVYVVEKLQNGLYYASEEAVASAQNYLSIPVQNPGMLPDRDGNLSGYTLNDAGTADVDGDGQYEIIIKWYPDNQFDSGSGNLSSPTIYDIYEMDGTAIWRLNLGLEIPSGAHFSQFMLYDLDEDGRAELFVKTSDGAISYRPNAEGRFDMKDESTIVSYVGDKNILPGSNVKDNGHVANTSNEYVTVFDGMTGEEIDTIDFINTTGEYVDWGKDDDGNRSARYNIAIAYLPVDQKNPDCKETIPAVILQRGYYAKTTVAAYTLREGKLNLEWNFVAPTGDLYAGKGNHNVASGDMDRDGFDEYVIGSMALDHDGTVLWAKTGTEGQDYGGHGDAIHLAAMNPEDDDLYVFSPQEACNVLTLNYSLTNAGTGGRYLGSWFNENDAGRAVAANITANPGYEFWAAPKESGIYGFDGSLISKGKDLPHNWVLYWDGDLFSELGDGDSKIEGNAQISKYNEVTERCDILATFKGTAMCNGTKNTPSLTADLLGDWREEVVVRSADNTELRIYMTTIETDYMIFTLMHDSVYRNAVANQNSGYNQPPHVGFYLGEDNRETVLNRELITADVRYGAAVNEEGSEKPGEFGKPDDSEKPDEPEDSENPSVPVEPSSKEQVAAFVERMYTVALDREAESEGAAWWTAELLAGKSDGAGLAQGFLTGTEFQNKGYSNVEYVAVLYDTFFNREIAGGEGDFWIAALDGGETRESVLSGFVNSTEFFKLCAEYGISRGTMKADGIAIHAGIGQFAERLYTEVLGREGEEDGMEYWAASIANSECTPRNAARSFFTSDEYVEKNTTNQKYIETLYRTFMGRESDEGGMKFWLNSMNAGTDDRTSALNSFAESVEFQKIMVSFGLQ